MALIACYGLLGAVSKRLSSFLVTYGSQMIRSVLSNWFALVVNGLVSIVLTLLLMRTLRLRRRRPRRMQSSDCFADVRIS